MKTVVSPKQVAQAIGASEASLKRWCDKGLLQCSRTAGGHRRLPISAVVEFLRRSGHHLVNPEVLGLPSNTGAGGASLERAAETMTKALVAGEEDTFRRLVFDLFLAGKPAVKICDQAITPAFRTIGHHWENGSAEVYQERRAVEICRTTLTQLRGMLNPPQADAPLAIGGTPQSDPYELPGAVVDLALRESGWRTQLLGVNLPVETLCKAIVDEKPRLFWLCVSWLPNDSHFVEGYAQLFDVASANNVPIAVGGRALTPELRRRMRYATFCDNLDHLITFANSIAAPQRASAMHA